MKYPRTYTYLILVAILFINALLDIFGPFVLWGWTPGTDMHLHEYTTALYYSALSLFCSWYMAPKERR